MELGSDSKVLICTDNLLDVTTEVPSGREGKDADLLKGKRSSELHTTSQSVLQGCKSVPHLALVRLLWLIPDKASQVLHGRQTHVLRSNILKRRCSFQLGC